MFQVANMTVPAVQIPLWSMPKPLATDVTWIHSLITTDGENRSLRSGFVTKQLFPVSGGGREAPPLQNQGLGLTSEGNYGGPPEKMIVAQQQH